MSIRKKVANLWAPLLQNKGNSTTQPMSQKAVSDELNQLKSDLDNKVNKSNICKTYEELIASTDLNNVAGADALKDIYWNRVVRCADDVKYSYVYHDTNGNWYLLICDNSNVQHFFKLNNNGG